MKSEIPVIYYQDELEDEFSTATISPKTIDGSYQYENSSKMTKFMHVFWYKIVARPLAYLYLKLWYGHKIIHRERIKTAGDSGYFLYGNHTNAAADALIPSMVNYPVDTYVIVHPNNVSMPVLGRITPSLGALPLPDDAEAAKNFMKAVKHKIEQKQCVMIYPEAHIWPYYTKIRPFTEKSFRYPVQYQVPVFCFTNTYQKRRGRKTPRIVTYVDGPFYPDKTLSSKEQKKELRDRVYETMVKRSQNNNIELIKYIKAGET